MGRTESIANNLDPVFQRGVAVNYTFEVDQQLTFTAMDDDTGADDALGVAKCSLAAIVNSKVPYSIPMMYRDYPVGSI